MPNHIKDQSLVEAYKQKDNRWLCRNETFLPKRELIVWYVYGEKCAPSSTLYNQLQLIMTGQSLAMHSFNSMLERMNEERLQHNYPGFGFSLDMFSELAMNQRACKDLGLKYTPECAYYITWDGKNSCWNICDMSSFSEDEIMAQTDACIELWGRDRRTLRESRHSFISRRAGYKNSNPEERFDAFFDPDWIGFNRWDSSRILFEFEIEFFDGWLGVHFPTSRLRISKDYRIFMVNYGKEVKIQQLPKAIFFFFLLHKDGCLIADLPLYREEITNLYSAIVSVEGGEVNQGLLDLLFTLESESFVAQCQAIRKSFDEQVGYVRNIPYYIYGDPGKPKRIAIDRSFVEWEK